MGTRTHATLTLLTVIGVMFLAVVAAADWLSARLPPRVPYEAILVLGAKNNAAIEAGEVWRLGTSILLHGSLLHLAFNAYALYVLGTVLERLYGARRFLLVFFVSGLGGAAASYLFTVKNSVGASGAIFGLLGAAVVFGFRFRGILPARIRRVLTVGLLPWVALNLVIGFVIPGIDNAAHLGGLITGCAVALVLGTPLEPGRRIPSAAALQMVLVIAAILALAWSVVMAVSSALDCTQTLDALSQCYEALAP